MKKIFALLIACAGFMSYGQDAKIKVKSIVIDSVSWPTHSEYTLTLEVKKPDVDKSKKVRLANALLITNHQASPQWDGNSDYNYFDSDYLNKDNNNTILLNTLPVDTIVRKIDTIRGTLHYFRPTHENGGIHTVITPLDKLGENLVADVLDDTKVIFLHPATLMKKGGNYENEVRALEDKHGLRHGVLKDELDAFIAGPPYGGIEYSYLYYITGNFKKIAKVDYLDETKPLGLQVGVIGIKNGDNSQLRYINYLEAPASGWKMDIYMETDTSVTKYDFILTDVKMPFKN